MMVPWTSSSALGALGSVALLAACSNGHSPAWATDEDTAEHSSESSSGADESMISPDSSSSEGSDDVGSGSSSTASGSASTTTHGDSSDTTDDETGDACLTPNIVCATECIDPLDNADFCGARGDCEGNNAGVHCTDGAQCLEGICRRLGWSEPQELTRHTATSGDALGLQLASGLEGSTLAVWRQYDVEGFRPSAWESRYDNATQSWTMPALIEAYPGQVMWDPMLSVDAEGVASVVWAHEFERKLRFEYARLTSPDAPWSEPSTLHSLPAVDASPQGLHVDRAGNLLLSWAQSQGNLRTRENYSVRFTASHLAWSAPELVAGDTAGDIFAATAAVAHDGSAFTFWSHRDDSGVSKLRSRSRDPAGAWKAPELLQDLRAMHTVADPQAAYDPHGVLTIVWVVERPKGAASSESQSEIWWARRNGHSWTRPALVVPPAVQAHSPTLHVDNAGTAHLTWLVHMGGEASQIWYTRLAKGSTSWALEHELGASAALLSRPILRTDHQRSVHAVWHAASTKADVPRPTLIHAARLPEDATEWIGEQLFSGSSDDANELHSVAVHPDGDVSVGWRQLNDGQAQLWVTRYEAGR